MTQFIQPVPSERFLWEETIPGGCHWSGHVKRGTAFRITDVSGKANLSALFFRSDLMLERYNMPDTLKAEVSPISMRYSLPNATPPYA